MKRSMRGRFIAFAGGALLTVACGQRLVLGTNGAALTSVSPAIVGTQASAVEVPPCDPGMAHPNVCCQAGLDGVPRCGVYEGNPFLPCPASWATYPDPRSCCSVDAPEQCQAARSSVAKADTECAYACPPGYYAAQPITATSGACCSVDGFSSGSCFGWSSSSASPAADAGPAPMSGPACNLPCPTGWQAVAATPASSELCCQGDVGTAARQCFSPATGAAYLPNPPPQDASPPPPPQDASPPPPPEDAGSPPPEDAGSLLCGVTPAGGCYCFSTRTNTGLKCDQVQCLCLQDDALVATAPSACPADAGGSPLPALHDIWTHTCGFPE